MDTSPNPTPRHLRLTVDFAGWLDDRPVEEEAFTRRGLIVLDANVLLDLYRVNPDARRQTVAVLDSVCDRLWVPHQAAVEFSRNRKRVVSDRLASFRRVREALRSAPNSAAEVLETAVVQLVELRSRNRTAGAFDLVSAKLDRESLRQRLVGVLDDALSEFEALEAEHDLHPKDMQYGDALLAEVDELLEGRIGVPYPMSKVRHLVDEAMNFRYPNQIPPGYLDAGKETPIRSAGDYLLWSQTIDRARQLPEADRLILMITNDLKADWWLLDGKQRTVGPRPELVQEMRDAADAHLHLTSLADFMESARSYLAASVSEQAVGELRRAESDSELSFAIGSILGSATVEQTRLQDVSPTVLEQLVAVLLTEMGYELRSGPDVDGGFDLVVYRSEIVGETTYAVQLRCQARPVGSEDVQAFNSSLSRRGLSGGLLFTTSYFSPDASKIGQELPIQMVDNAALRKLLAQYLGLDLYGGLEADSGSTG